MTTVGQVSADCIDWYVADADAPPPAALLAMTKDEQDNILAALYQMSRRLGIARMQRAAALIRERGQ